jgi:hypothetical protein
MSQRADLIKKIKSLLVKTVENGCIEAEAITAAEHAARLMEQYDLTFKDVEKEIREQHFKADARPFGHNTGYRRIFPAVHACTRAVAEFFDCMHWTSGIDLVFFGTEDDAALAHSMVAVLQSGIRHETDAHLARTAGNGEHPKTKRASFEHGVTERLRNRVRALKQARTEADKAAHEVLATEPTAAGSGAAFHAPVVVTKQVIVQEKFEELGIKLTSRKSYRSSGSRSSYQAGLAAGDRISLGARRGLLQS